MPPLLIFRAPRGREGSKAGARLESVDVAPTVAGVDRVGEDGVGEEDEAELEFGFEVVRGGNVDAECVVAFKDKRRWGFVKIIGELGAWNGVP